MSVRKIEITSAKPLTQKETARIEKLFSSKHKGESVDFAYKIDKSVIGGILVVDGDKYYDGTLRSQVDKIDTDYIAAGKYAESEILKVSEKKRVKRVTKSFRRSSRRQRRVLRRRRDTGQRTFARRIRRNAGSRKRRAGDSIKSRTG